MKNSLMYKMSYYRYVAVIPLVCILTCRFPELFGGHPAQDRVRGQKIPLDPVTLDTLGMFPASKSTVANAR